MMTLPSNETAERFVLGSVLSDDTFFDQGAGTLEPDDFTLEKHRRIFRRMVQIHARYEKIDPVTVANELAKLCAGHAQQFGGESPLPNLMEVKG